MNPAARQVTARPVRAATSSASCAASPFSVWPTPTEAAEESPSTSSEIAGSRPSMRWRTGPSAGRMRSVRMRTLTPCQT